MAFLGLYRFGHQPKAQPTQPMNHVALRRSVAVLGFRNLSGHRDDEWLSTVFTETLNTELGISSDLRMISGEDVAQAKREMPLGNEDSLGKASLNRFKGRVGADVVLLGSYLAVKHDSKNQLRLDLRLQDTSSGETISEDTVNGTDNDILELAARAGARLRMSLGVKAIPGSDNFLRAALPLNQTAARLYSEGRAKLWAFDMLGARALLTRAVAADPSYALGHSALSEALWHLGYLPKARQEAKRALELSLGSPTEDRLLVEGQYWRAMADWPRAIKAYQSLFDSYPDDIDYGLLLASAQQNVSSVASLATLNRLHQLPAPLGDDPRIDMAEASAWIGNDLSKAQAAAKKAIALGTAEGSNALVSRTLGIFCQQGVVMGVALDDAIGQCERARQSALAAGDINGAAMMLTDAAAMYFSKSEISRCQTMFRTAIQEFHTVGNLDGEATAKSNLAGALFSSGELDQARKLWQEAIPDYQAIQDRSGVALNLNNLGDLARQSGKLDVADARYSQAKATAEEAQDKSALAYVLSGQGDVAMDRGKYAAARKSYEESLALRTRIGEKESADEASTSLAVVSIEEGHAAMAEAALHPLIDEFAKQHQIDDQLIAATSLIHAYLAQGKQSDAERTMADFQTLAAHCQSRFTALQFRMYVARVLTSSAHPERAKPLLGEVLRDAQRHGYEGLQLEAQVLGARLELAGGARPQATVKLRNLQQEAETKGFGRIAMDLGNQKNEFPVRDSFKAQSINLSR